jgi:hypothetical protein
MSPLPKKYIHDKLVLLLLSVNVFLAFMSSVVILLRLGSGQGGGGYFVQYRSNLGISAFKTGGTGEVISFLVFAVVVVVVVSILSIKAYRMRRELSLIILSVGILLLALNAVVSNGLLRLH